MVVYTSAEYERVSKIITHPFTLILALNIPGLSLHPGNSHFFP